MVSVFSEIIIAYNCELVYNESAESDQMVTLGGFFLKFILRTPVQQEDNNNLHHSGVSLCHMPRVQ